VLLANFATVLTKSASETVSQKSLSQYRKIWAELAEEYKMDYVAMMGSVEPNLQHRV
jgi:wyosine [tRNA(Phe)-imidazoG37] synthetase (radical SAM superfamily)